MVLNFRQICEDKGIEISPPGYTCTSEGFTNIQCPFCDDTGYRLGYNDSQGYFHCFRCGSHRVEETLKQLFSLNPAQITDVKREYNHTGAFHVSAIQKQSATTCELPEGADTLKKPHCDYLRTRNFSPKDLALKWNIQGTGFTGNYAQRIIAPIYVNGVLVSYQGRDITNHAKLRYKACKTELEVVHHKDTVYGLDHALPFKQCLVVEGITDTWRLGYGAVCTFGIKWTQNQMRLLANNFEKVYILFDNEPQAQSQAEALCSELLFRGVECEVLTDLPVGTDPGELEQQEADKYMKGLGFITWENLNE